MATRIFLILLLTGILKNLYAHPPLAQYLRAHMQTLKKHHAEQEALLEKIEKKISRIRARQRHYHNQIKSNQHQLHRLKLEQKKWQHQHHDLKAHLTEVLPELYQNSYGDTPQQQANRVNIILWMQHHQHTLENQDQHLHQLQPIKQRIQKQSQKLSALQQHWQQEEKQLKKEQHKRELALTSLKHALQRTHAQLRKAEHDQQRLNNLAQKLSRKTEKISPPLSFLGTQYSKPLSSMLSKSLDPEPTLHRKGRWYGAPAGTPIHAIAPGRVLFADWMGGFGNVIIIRHRNHAMSIYGHAQTLLVQENQLVTPKTLLGEVGQSGGMSKTGLYLEVRAHPPLSSS